MQGNDSVMCGYYCIKFIDFMLAGKKLTDFTSMFSPYDFEKNDRVILHYFKMDECNSLEIDKAKLTKQTKIRLNKITEIKGKLCSKKISKYVAAFDYIDKVLIVLSATSDRLSISFTSVVGAPVGMESFTLTTRIIKKLLSIIKNKKKKHDKIFLLAKSKLNGKKP